MRTRKAPLITTVLSAFLVVLLLPHLASGTEAEEERERVREERAAAATNVDALRGDKAEVEAALQALNERLAGEEAALDNAEREKAEADEAQLRAQEGIDEAEARLGELEQRLREQMVEAYTDGENSSVGVLDASSATDLVKRRAILEGQAADDDDLTDQVRAAEAELEAQRRAATEAGERAADKAAEVQERIESVEAARAEQQGFAADVQTRIDGELARAIELGQRDRELSAQIVREQAELQARLALQRYREQKAAEEAAAAAAAAEAEEAAAQEAPAPAPAPAPSYGDGGSEPAPVAAPGGVTPAGSGGGVSLCNAGGITVNCQIAEQVRSLLAAAAADGLQLSGGGYRDPSNQIALREQNCGSSYYAIYEMSSSSCSPPTARPGSSNHEVGLAIDFSNCQSRGSACYQWLNANASRFGLYNLPSEPWHWSNDGT
ncbi:D-alanyl-D-alanine carboxypeptidase family protein [Iamia majanohamensis]|uniref:D-alanyl-D-alanine carboxypeptidase family protein n=1 Tax=Iamia majanohamensis TaxID=467976 RepID=A0AAE9Y8Q3_9ACTN|nr:D-alanyl-D-alanine carboxypeptidase family protein [Iamia majanohamensis]WCO68820.1 D-alanyl-D-alanine carboxypeptidase family protein [Iamia majanohamensis]